MELTLEKQMALGGGGLGPDHLPHIPYVEEQDPPKNDRSRGGTEEIVMIVSVSVLKKCDKIISPFLTETLVKLVSNLVGLGVKHPEVGASRWAWRRIRNLHFFLRSHSFPRPLARA
ncbi:hypothetical protein ACSQ67_019082 [Phaseolus vulgaris]